MGLAAGGLSTALLYASEPYFAESPAAAANVAGSLIGCGCLLATLMTGATYFAGSVPLEMAALAVFPVLFFFVFFANRFAVGPPARGRQRGRYRARNAEGPAQHCHGALQSAAVLPVRQRVGHCLLAATVPHPPVGHQSGVGHRHSGVLLLRA